MARVRTEKHRERDRLYYAAHREERKAYREATRERRQAKDRLYYATHKEARKAYRESHRTNRKIVSRIYRLKSKYNLTPSEYQSLFDRQQGCCAICHRNIQLVIDHNHTNGFVRGLLCRRCNTGLGYFNEDQKMLADATSYLAEV